MLPKEWSGQAFGQQYRTTANDLPKFIFLSNVLSTSELVAMKDIFQNSNLPKFDLIWQMSSCLFTKGVCARVRVRTCVCVRAVHVNMVTSLFPSNMTAVVIRGLTLVYL